MITTLLWDHDGVLVDTEGLYFRATREVLASVGLTEPTSRRARASACPPTHAW